jgi:hypothetical protein
MTQTVIYPRLYRTERPGKDEEIFSQGDQSIAELYRICENGMQDTRPLDFRFRVLDRALVLFGEDFRAWMLLQRNDPNLIGYNIEFLRDTLTYITHGRRDMSPLTWIELVSEVSENDIAQHHLTTPELAVPKGQSTSEILQLWCSRKGGFDDLMQSLNLLFGSARGRDR